MKTALAIDSICYLFGVTREDYEEEVVKVLKRHETEIRKDERLKIAVKVRALSIDEITDADTLYNAILKT